MWSEGSWRPLTQSLRAHEVDFRLLNPTPPPTVIAGSLANPGDGTPQQLAPGGPSGVPRLRPALPRGPGPGSQAHQRHHRWRGEGGRTLTPTSSRSGVGCHQADEMSFLIFPVCPCPKPQGGVAFRGGAYGSKSCSECPSRVADW